VINSQNPEFLWLLLLLPAIGYYLWWRRKKIIVTLQFSSLQIFNNIPQTLRERLRHVPLALRLLAIAVFIIAFARPQSVSDKQNISTEGIDIVLELDLSGSMLAEDFSPNRIEAASKSHQSSSMDVQMTASDLSCSLRKASRNARSQRIILC